MSQRSIAEVLEVCPKSVSTWLSRASDQSEAITETRLKDMEVPRVEMDELWTFVGKKKSRKTKNMKMKEHGSG
jgi:predicted transcriptional regulator